MLITRLGIDATMPEGIPEARYQRIQYAHLDEIALDDLLGGGATFVSGAEATETLEAMELAGEVEGYLQANQPRYYMEVVDHFAKCPHRMVVQAMGLLYDQGRLARDEEGRYLLAGT